MIALRTIYYRTKRIAALTTESYPISIVGFTMWAFHLVHSLSVELRNMVAGRLPQAAGRHQAFRAALCRLIASLPLSGCLG